MKNWAESQKVEGLQLEVVTLEGRTPVIYAEVPDTAGNGEYARVEEEEEGGQRRKEGAAKVRDVRDAAA